MKKGAFRVAFGSGRRACDRGRRSAGWCDPDRARRAMDCACTRPPTHRPVQQERVALFLPQWKSVVLKSHGGGGGGGARQWWAGERYIGRETISDAAARGPLPLVTVRTQSCVKLTHLQSAPVCVYIYIIYDVVVVVVAAVVVVVVVVYIILRPGRNLGMENGPLSFPYILSIFSPPNARPPILSFSFFRF